MSSFFWDHKDPSGTSTYAIDWTLDDGDAIASAVWSAPGLTVVATSSTSTRTTITLSGGTVSVGVYAVTCTITTTAGLVFPRTASLRVANL